MDDVTLLMSLKAQHRRARIGIHAWRVGIVIALLSFWQFAPPSLINVRWFSRPSLIATRLMNDLMTLELWHHIAVTLVEMAVGFAIGISFGAVAGLAYGRSRRYARIADPLVIAAYSIPLVALSPLFILWFGLGIFAKAALVAVTVFWLIFFNVASGVRQVETELVTAMNQLGGNRLDEWRLVVIPSTAQWFFAGIKLSVPYALAGAVVAEMVAASEGLGYLAARAASFLRMDALYAVVIVLVIFGVILNGIAEWIERYFGRWHSSQQVQS